jgi:conjugal transfer pilus assembly protein TraK
MRALLFSTIALAATLGLSPAPAFADQFQMAADNARVPCAVSRRELTRFSLVGDQFAALNKIAAGTPYNDFSVTHDPLRGDIYLSVPDGFAPRTC